MLSRESGQVQVHVHVHVHGYVHVTQLADDRSQGVRCVLSAHVLVLVLVLVRCACE